MSSGGFMARCPAHEDATASLSISYGRDQPVVFMCHAGCDSRDILARLGLTWSDLSKPLDLNGRRRAAEDTWIACGWDRERRTYDHHHRKVAEYICRDQHDNVVFGVARCALK